MAADFQNRSRFEIAKRRAELYNSDVGHETGYDCPDCLNRGNIAYVIGTEDNFREEILPCKCESIRRNLWRIRESGLQDLIDRYTFDLWKTPQAWQEWLRNRAIQYAENPSGWFFIGGKPGTGKTHLCTAICKELMMKGMETRYILWREFSQQAKAVTNNDEKYADFVGPVRKVPLLYIDDFFKTGRRRDIRTGLWQEMTPTEADINLAFDILGSRYNQGNRTITIISSELPVEKLMDIDAAIASRIYQNAGENIFDLSKMENWRLKE